MTVDIRPYQPGDESAILSLFAESHPGREMSLAEWTWRYPANPAGPGYVMLGWEGSRLVAHYATMSRSVLANGARIRTELSVNTMTAPSHRGQRLFQRLTEATYSALEADGIAAVWGFPNSMSHRIFVRDLGWRNLGVIPFLRCPLDGRRTESGGLDGVVEIERGDSRIDSLWHRCAGQLDIAGVTDGAYCRWRFSDARGEKYRLLALPAADGALEALAVWKIFREEAQVVLVLAADEQARKAMLEAVLATARQDRMSSVAVWCSLHDRSHLELERLGFTLDAPVTYLGWRPLDRDAHCDPRMERLTVQMHDSDIF